MIAGNDNYLGVILSSSTFYIIKRRRLAGISFHIFFFISWNTVHEPFTGEEISGLLNLFFYKLYRTSCSHYSSCSGNCCSLGRSGLISSLGLAGISLFGLWMVILAHVFFNAPLVLRIAYSALKSQPSYYWKLASHNNLTELEIFQAIEWPAFKSFMVPLASLIFLLCFTSFSIVLMLGGGPDVTTLEVSIYHAVRFSFDMQLAASLSIVQILICSGLILISKPLNFSLTSCTKFRKYNN